MRNDPRNRVDMPASPLPTSPAIRSVAYEPPRFEVIALDCEITAYAPDGDDPLF